MKAFYYLLAFVLFSTNSFAIDLSSGSWSTSFNCNSIATCYDFANQEGSATLCSQSTTFSSSDNNPLGSNNAIKVIIADGSNSYTYTGGYSWSPGEPELWIRFYIKYPTGFAWSPLVYHKWIYLHTAAWYDGGSALILEPYNGNVMRLHTTTTAGIIDDADKGWEYIMGGSTSDGNWHSIEMHVKTDTNGSNGVYQAWVDGTLVANHSGLNFDQQNFYWFILPDNQSTPANGVGCSHVLVDDVAIHTDTPPAMDIGGNPMIGPIGWAGVLGGKMSGGGAISSGGYMR